MAGTQARNKLNDGACGAIVAYNDHPDVESFTVTFGHNVTYWDKNWEKIRCNPLYFTSIKIKASNLIKNQSIQTASTKPIPTAMKNIRFLKAKNPILQNYRIGYNYRRQNYLRDPENLSSILQIIYKQSCNRRKQIKKLTQQVDKLETRIKKLKESKHENNGLIQKWKRKYDVCYDK